MSLPPSVFVAFDASVLYADDNATPVSGAIGFVIREGHDPTVECSRPVDQFVSNVALEYRALAEAAAAVDAAYDRVGSVHVRGDADVVVRTVDPGRPAEPSNPVVGRRVAATRASLADAARVDYRAVDGDRNRRAHTLARRGHRRWGRGE
ncbi:hypothetical protein [Halobaculum sp. MBLA0143]|uniref:hypothetical protein n=1 Tax=Halobaculum sp. MBLA0143 TaxID=3079933 RepID=UPI003525CD7E